MCALVPCLLALTQRHLSHWGVRPLPFRFFEVNISLEETNAALLLSKPRNYAPARVDLGSGFIDADVKLKGHASFQPLNEKPNWTIRFKSQTPEGKRIYLHNSAQDKSFLRSTAYAFFAKEVGLPIQRQGFAWVKVNGRTLGLYCLVHALDNSELDHLFGQHNGALFKGDVEISNNTLEQENGMARKSEWPHRVEKVIEEAEGKAESLWAYFDVHSARQLLAVDIATGNKDGYCFGKNNYRLFVQDDRNQAIFIPHSLEFAFSDSRDVLFQYPLEGKVTRLLTDNPTEAVPLACELARLVRPSTERRAIRAITEVQKQLSKSVGKYDRAISVTLKQEAQTLYKNISAQSSNNHASVDVWLRTLTAAGSLTKTPPAWELIEATGDVNSSKVSNTDLDVDCGSRGGRFFWRYMCDLPPGRFALCGRVKSAPTGSSSIPSLNTTVFISTLQTTATATNTAGESDLKYTFKIVKPANQSILWYKPTSFSLELRGTNVRVRLESWRIEKIDNSTAKSIEHR